MATDSKYCGGGADDAWVDSQRMLQAAWVLQVWGGGN